MITRILISLGVFWMMSPGLAFADSFSWQVDQTEFSITATNFEIKDMTVYMQCRFSDGSGGFDGSPAQELEFELTHVSENSNGTNYQVKVEAGNYDDGKWFADLKSCSYRIKIVSDQIDEISKELITSRFSLVWAELETKAQQQEFLKRNIAQEIKDTANPMILTAEHWGIDWVNK